MAAGLAILTRIMAVSFLVAGVGWILFAHRNAWRTHLRGAGLALLAATLTAGPYFVNCWRVYGDPLYTFNVHGAIYSAAEGEADWKGSTASYVSNRIAQRPIAIVDTVAQGLTSYPFTNKWQRPRPLDAETRRARVDRGARRARRARRIAVRTSAVDRDGDRAPAVLLHVDRGPGLPVHGVRVSHAADCRGRRLRRGGPRRARAPLACAP